MNDQNLEIGFVAFPNVTQLDLTGPFEVLSRISGARCKLIWKSREPVRAYHGFVFTPDVTFAEVDRLDIVCVPGGNGVNALIEDEMFLNEVRRLAYGALYVTAVCTGALVLGAAGLLVGKRATTHWMSLDLLQHFGATPVAERVVFDGNVVTGGGVTAGIDFALALAAEISGAEAAQSIQLSMEYDPKPPFDSGSPNTAAQDLVDQALNDARVRQRERLARVKVAAARVSTGGERSE